MTAPCELEGEPENQFVRVKDAIEAAQTAFDDGLRGGRAEREHAYRDGLLTGRLLWLIACVTYLCLGYVLGRGR